MYLRVAIVVRAVKAHHATTPRSNPKPVKMIEEQRMGRLPVIELWILVEKVFVAVISQQSTVPRTNEQMPFLVVEDTLHAVVAQQSALSLAVDNQHGLAIQVVKSLGFWVITRQATVCSHPDTSVSCHRQAVDHPLILAR